MKILTYDIETSPNLAHVWSLWNQNVGLAQLREASEVMCFAAKWVDRKEVIFRSVFHDGRNAMLDEAHALMSEADILVGYNHKGFDNKHLNKEFVQAGYSPPSPAFDVDLLHVVRKNFRFPSNKLDYVSSVLLGRKKVKHAGHQLWVDCLAGDERAWNKMKRYNIGDVRLTEKLYLKLRPWISNHPHPALFGDAQLDACPSCGSGNLRKEGLAYTRLGAFQRYQCKSCGRWSRDGKRLFGVATR